MDQNVSVNVPRSDLDVDIPQLSDKKTCLPETYEWGRLDSFARLMLEKDSRTEAERRLDRQKQHKSDLDKQIAEINGRRSREQELDKQFASLQAAEAERWKTEEDRKDMERRFKAEKEREHSDMQLKLDAERKRQQLLNHKEDEKNELRRLDEGIQKEKVEQIARKQSERMITKKLMEENEKERALKLDIKKQQSATELCALREYNELLERQEQERQLEFNRRIERQKLLIRRMEEGVFKAIQTKSNNDHIRADKQQADLNERRNEMEQFKTAKIKQLKSEMLEALQTQLREKKLRSEVEAVQRAKQAEILRLNVESYEKQQEDRMRRRKQELCRYREELLEQINSMKAKRTSVRDEMTTDEILLNRELIELVDSVLPKNV
jgi:hypothetical protein